MFISHIVAFAQNAGDLLQPPAISLWTDKTTFDEDDLRAFHNSVIALRGERGALHALVEEQDGDQQTCPISIQQTHNPDGTTRVDKLGNELHCSASTKLPGKIEIEFDADLTAVGAESASIE